MRYIKVGLGMYRHHTISNNRLATWPFRTDWESLLMKNDFLPLFNYFFVSVGVCVCVVLGIGKYNLDENCKTPFYIIDTAQAEAIINTFSNWCQKGSAGYPATGRWLV